MKLRYGFLSLLSTFVMACIFSSCHFGDPEEMRPTFADRKRNINYSLTVGFPFASSSVYSIEDYNIEGLKINWNQSESLAVFGKVFQMEADTLVGSAALPQVLKLRYDARRDGEAGLTGDIKTLDFSFEAWAKHGEGENNAEKIPVVYPYSKVLNSEGFAPKANADSILLNFNGQDGILQHLRDSFFVTMGKGVGVVNNGVGTIKSIETDYVSLVPKFAIVRLALTFPAEQPYTLREYINCRSISESVRYIDNISLSNENESASGFNQMILNLQSAKMQASANAQPRLLLRSHNAFYTLTDIPYENYISLEPIGGKSISWGTMLYVAIPCPDEGSLQFQGLIEVNVVERSTGKQIYYYGKLAPVDLKEGVYYLTSAVHLKESAELLDDDAAEVVEVPSSPTEQEQ